LVQATGCIAGRELRLHDGTLPLEPGFITQSSFNLFNSLYFSKLATTGSTPHSLLAQDATAAKLRCKGRHFLSNNGKPGAHLDNKLMQPPCNAPASRANGAAGSHLCPDGSKKMLVSI